MNGRLRIAVADDEADMRRFLCRVLTHEGHQVVVAAESGHQLIRECQLMQPDLVITDVAMPDLDGLQAIHLICATKPVPSIVVSAKSEDDLLVRASNELVFAYLIKPIKMDDLRPAIWLTMRRFNEFTRLQTQLAGRL
jgi:AmiR/NasT family two-component response regulator